MRTAAREAASQIALRHCSKDCSGRKTINKVLVMDAARNSDFIAVPRETMGMLQGGK